MLNRFLIDFQQCRDVAEISSGNHAVTSSLISQNFILHIKKLFCYNVIILAIEESAITRLQKYLKSFKGAKTNFLLP